MKYTAVLSVIVVSVALACTPSPQEIHYGEDACHSCLMTIVDERHAAELVTSKGKVFKFDAIECMVRYIEEAKGQEYAYALVCDYDNPRSLIDAENAAYLISPSIPSPMGAFLSAFNMSKRAKEVQKEKDGQVYDWNSVQQVIN